MEEALLGLDSLRQAGHVLDKGSGQVYVCAWRAPFGDDPDKTLVQFTLSRNRFGPKQMLGDWKRTLVTDGYGGYGEVCRENGITRAGCWAHARRKVKEAFDLRIPGSREVLVPIQRLVLRNKAGLYGLLFRAAARSLQEIAIDEKHLGAEIGFLAVLHLVRLCVIRHYGFLSNRARKEKLGLVRELVTQARDLPQREVAEPPTPAAQPEDRAPARHPCPACRKGHLVVVAELSATDLMLHEARSRAPP